MLRVVLALASIALTVFALADCIQADSSRVRGIPRWGWIVLIVLVPWAGPLTWIVVGTDRFGILGPVRASTGTPSGPRRRPGPLAPDEDPEFLRRLDEQIRREKREQARREQNPDDDGPDGGPEPGASDPDGPRSPAA